MLPFFKKNKDEKLKLEGRESSVSSKDFFNEEAVDTINDNDIETELSIHPSWNLAKEDIYSFQFLNRECLPLKPNQVSLSGISVMPDTDGVRVTAFVRNSLDKTIQLKDPTLVLLGSKDETLGRKKFELSELGDIPPRSSRPWYFHFTKKDLFTDEIPAEGWKLAFQLEPSSRKHSLDLADSWKKSLASEDQQKLAEMVENLTPPKEGEVNFLGLQSKISPEGDLHVTMLIRNGSDKDINLEQIPLIVEDAVGDVIAKGGFKLEEFTVKSNTSKPWTFIFPQSLVMKAEPDLSRWKAYPPKKN